MDELDRRKAQLACKNAGFDHKSHSSSRWFELALEAEEIKRTLPPGDIAQTRFIMDLNGYFGAALLAEADEIAAKTVKC